MSDSAKKKWYNHPWTISITAVFLSQLLFPAFMSVNSKMGFWTAFRTMWSWLVTPIPMPLIVAMALAVLLILYVHRIIPLHNLYTEDMFYGMVWKWRFYRYYRKDKLQISLEHDSYCPNCDMKLRVNRYSNKQEYECVKCRLVFCPFKSIRDAESQLISDEILRRLRTGAWVRYFLAQRLLSMRGESFGLDVVVKHIDKEA